mmetsp:Transcript_26483/g.36420  ORF Transcript_26483/g.36420 Transcript_26483/m.36420 type:complete len:212 (-) Transcript_26483:8-643(-)
MSWLLIILIAACEIVVELCLEADDWSLQIRTCWGEVLNDDPKSSHVRIVECCSVARLVALRTAPGDDAHDAHAALSSRGACFARTLGLAAHRGEHGGGEHRVLGDLHREVVSVVAVVEVDGDGAVVRVRVVRGLADGQREAIRFTRIHIQKQLDSQGVVSVESLSIVGGYGAVIARREGDGVRDCGGPGQRHGSVGTEGDVFRRLVQEAHE